MSVKIRLSRKGKKRQPFYHIIAANVKAPRDGKFIEKIGTYNPYTKPSAITLDFERSIYWLDNGAQTSKTVRSILSSEGVLYKRFLLKGLTKGALKSEEVEEKFNSWKKERAQRKNNKFVSVNSSTNEITSFKEDESRKQKRN